MSWLDIFANRCQTLAGEVPDSPRRELAARIRALVSDVPAQLRPADRAVARAFVSHVLGKVACLTGIATRPEVALAFVVWAAADPTSDALNIDVTRIVDCCAAALDATPADHAAADPRVQRALLVIGNRFADPSLSVGDVASEVGASIRHTARLLKVATGVGFTAQVHRLRIAAARRMLRTTTRSVKEISAAVGYGSSSQFGRHFRRLTGTTPYRYRSMLAT